VKLRYFIFKNEDGEYQLIERNREGMTKVACAAGEASRNVPIESVFESIRAIKQSVFPECFHLSPHPPFGIAGKGLSMDERRRLREFVRSA
jgi:hypothetical protein